MIPRTPPGRRFVTNASLNRRTRTSMRADASLPLASNAIARLDYNPDTQEMVITFSRNGSSYIIPGMTELEANRWANADSPGSYFNSYIRGRY